MSSAILLGKIVSISGTDAVDISSIKNNVKKMRFSKKKNNQKTINRKIKKMYFIYFVFNNSTIFPKEFSNFSVISCLSTQTATVIPSLVCGFKLPLKEDFISNQ